MTPTATDATSTATESTPRVALVVARFYPDLADEIAAEAEARVALDRRTPVGFGVLGPDMSGAEARERLEKAASAIDAALDTYATLETIASTA